MSQEESPGPVYSRLYAYLLVIERLEVDMNKMVNLLKFGCWEVVEKSPAKARVSTALPVKILGGSSFMSTEGRCSMFAVKMSKSM